MKVCQFFSKVQLGDQRIRAKLPINPVVNRTHHEFFGTSVKMKGREKDKYTHNWMMCDIKGA